MIAGGPPPAAHLLLPGKGARRGATNAARSPLAHLFVGLLVVAAVFAQVSPAPPPEPGLAGPDLAGEAIDAAPEAVAEMGEVSAGQEQSPTAAAGGASVANATADRSTGADRPALTKPFRYAVAAGDSLAALADRFGIDVPTLLGANELDDPDLLPTGLELTILPMRGVLYRVAEGDSLYGIAERFDVATREILRVNEIDDPELIRAGDALIVPDARWPATAAASAETSAEPPAAPSETAASAPDWAWPASGRITTYFGFRGPLSPRGHAGLDIAAPWGAPVRAAATGRVILSTRYGGQYGYQIIVDHGDGLRTVYAHLSSLQVEAGEPVEAGELIGLVGSTGLSTGPHLHFEIRRNGEPRDPLRYLP